MERKRNKRLENKTKKILFIVSELQSDSQSNSCPYKPQEHFCGGCLNLQDFSAAHWFTQMELLILIFLENNFTKHYLGKHKQPEGKMVHYNLINTKYKVLKSFLISLSTSERKAHSWAEYVIHSANVTSQHHLFNKQQPKQYL